MEEADRAFFERVQQGFAAIALAEPNRVRRIDATQGIDDVSARVWEALQPFLKH